MGVFDTASGELNAVDCVSGCSTAAIHDAILATVGRGWLLSFGSSRDGGAVSLTVLHDEGKERIWAGTPDELERALTAVVAAADGSTGTTGPEGGSVASGGETEASQKKQQVRKGK